MEKKHRRCHSMVFDAAAEKRLFQTKIVLGLLILVQSDNLRQRIIVSFILFFSNRHYSLFVEFVHAIRNTQKQR